VFIYFWGEFFGDDFFHNLATKRNFKIRNSTTIPYIPKGHKKYLSKINNNNNIYDDEHVLNYCASYLHDLDTPKFDVELNFVIVMIIYVEGDFKAYHHMNKGDELNYVTYFTRPRPSV
jgi:hypothetical protein